MQHTPGPWKLQGKTISSIDHGKHYAVAHAWNDSFTVEANEANARLIAAAPDLLAALADLLACTMETYDNRHEIAAALDAIAAAKGQQ